MWESWEERMERAERRIERSGRPLYRDPLAWGIAVLMLASAALMVWLLYSAGTAAAELAKPMLRQVPGVTWRFEVTESVKQYRKKPILVDAILWTEENLDEVLEFAVKRGWGGRVTIATGLSGKEVNIDTLKGTRTASVGDYIVCGVAGEHYELYPMKPTIFHRTYEALE